MGYAMQDAARHVSYGLGALRYYLRYQPEERTAVIKYLDDSEHAMAGLIGAPELLEPLIIICGGGLEHRRGEPRARGRTEVYPVGVPRIRRALERGGDQSLRLAARDASIAQAAA